jgi:polyhydroxybutyrate depolymerase
MREHPVRREKPALVAIAAVFFLGCPSDEPGADDSDTDVSTGSTSTGTIAPSTSSSESSGGASSSSDGSTSSTSGSSSSGGESSGDSSSTGEMVGSVGCRSGEGLPEGETTFELDGATRRYRLYLPTGYTGAEPWPLLFALHPNGGNIEYWNGEDGNQAIRPVVQDEAILVLAEDITNNWPDDLPTELAYIDYIANEMKTQLCVDESRIFSMGFSGGGSFSGVLGCMRDDIRAIASGGAIIYFEPADCINAPAAWVTIGELELIPGREEFRDFWRDTGGCDETTMPVEPDPCVAYDNCNADTPVHYCQHAGDHVWPDFGTEAAWAFLSQF